MVADTISVRGVTLRADPARESCLRVVHLYAELWRTVDMSPESQREKLHREYNTEVQGMEIAAQSLAEFPDAPWQLRMEIARQCWDESRHARLYLERLLAKGGFKGEFPIANHEWTTTCVFDTLPARLMVQNRTFESGSLDSMRKAIQVWSDAGDTRTAEITDAILADEVQHVRYANQWLNRLGREDPKVVLQVAAAVAQLKHMSAALRPQVGDMSVNGVDLYSNRHVSVRANLDDRGHAGFTTAEIGEVADRQAAEERSLSGSTERAS